MSSIVRSFTVPADLWNRLRAYRDDHPEFNISGFIAGKIKELVEKEEPAHAV